MAPVTDDTLISLRGLMCGEQEVLVIEWQPYMVTSISACMLLAALPDPQPLHHLGAIWELVCLEK